MHAAAWVLLGVAGAFAAADWIAVSPPVARRNLEYACKPATLVLLIGVALVLHPRDGAERALFVAALVLSLAGDVFLMLPADLFIAGLGSFLAAHLAYVAGFALEEHPAGALAIACASVVLLAATVGRRIVGAVVAGSQRAMAAPVVVYMLAISAMVVLAASTGRPLPALGAGLFFVSDSLIAWDRFVKPFRWSRPAIMATYHLAQAFLVLSIAR